MIYIIGIGRSGSTLLTKTLNKHKYIKALPEIPVLLFFAQKFKYIENKNSTLEKNVVDYLNLIQKIRPKEQVDITSAINFDHINYSNYFEFIKILYSKFEIEGKKGICNIYVDKNPQYSLFIEQISKIDPEAKFIVLVRDPRDNVLSRKNKVNNKPSNIAYNSFRYKFFYDHINASKTNEIFFLKYEDFILHNEQSIDKLLKFINLESESSLFEVSGTQQKYSIEDPTVNRFANIHFKELEKPLNASHIEKWKNELSNKEVAIIENIVKPHLEKFNYKTTKKPQPYSEMVVRYFYWYLLAKWHIKKEFFIYHSPVWLKLWRLKKMFSK